MHRPVMYDITIHPDRQLIAIRTEGFWSASTMAAYMDELRTKLKLLRDLNGCRRVLVDMRAYPIQSQPVAEAHAAALRFAREQSAVKVAVVMPSTLARLQALRLVVSTGHRMFNDVPSATAWLMEDEAVPHAA